MIWGFLIINILLIELNVTVFSAKLTTMMRRAHRLRRELSSCRRCRRVYVWQSYGWWYVRVELVSGVTAYAVLWLLQEDHRLPACTCVKVVSTKQLFSIITKLSSLLLTWIISTNTFFSVIFIFKYIFHYQEWHSIFVKSVYIDPGTVFIIELLACTIIKVLLLALLIIILLFFPILSIVFFI